MNPLDSLLSNSSKIIKNGKQSLYSTNPLLSAVPAKPKTPVSFGIPNAPAATPALPQTAATTRQNVSPAPFAAPQAPRPPLNPLDIIRKGKELSVSQDTRGVDPSSNQNLAIRKLPILGALIAGKGKNTVYEENTLPGFLEKNGALGALFESKKNYENPDREVISRRVMAKADALIAAGTPENEAYAKAIADLQANTPLSNEQFAEAYANQKTGNNSKLARPRSIDELLTTGITLTDKEKRRLFLGNQGTKFMAALDMPGIAATTKPIKMATKEFLKPAKYTPEMTKAVNDFVDLTNKTRKFTPDETVQIKATAQELADALKKTGRITADVPVKGDKGLATLLIKHRDESAAVLGDVAKADVADPKNFKTADEYVKAQGTPVYHGTLENFDSFDGAKAGSNTEWANAKFGTFFLDDATKAKEFPELARMTGDTRPVNVKEVYIDLKNPLDLTLKGILTKEKQAPLVYKILSGETASPKEALKLLDDAIDLGTVGDLKDGLYGDIANKKLMQAAGYDGIISDYGDGIVEKVVFDTKQIKTRKQLDEAWNKANKPQPSPLRPDQKPIGSNPVVKKGEEYVGTEEIVARERFNIPALKKISFGGSDRDVYDLGDGNVLKIAKSARGLDQNRMGDWYAGDVGLIPKVIEKGKNYTVFEKVDAPDVNTKKMVAELKKLGSPSRFSGDYYKKMDEFIAVMEKYGYPGEELRNYGDNFLWNDMLAIRNWGSKDGVPVHLDEGSLDGDLVSRRTVWQKDSNGYRVNKTQSNMDDPEFRSAYYDSKAAKKQFGDTDQKTMYAAGGSVSGVEQDEEGNITYDPIKAAIGMAGVGAIGSLRSAKIPLKVTSSPVKSKRSPIDIIKNTRRKQYKATPEQVKDYESRLTAFSGAEAGERLVKDNADGTFGGYVAKRSSFPTYVDEDLRRRKLFDQYMKGRDGTAEDFSISYKPGSKLDRLDQQVKESVGVKEIKVRQMVRSKQIASLEQAAIEQANAVNSPFPLVPKRKTVLSPGEVNTLEESALKQVEALDLPPEKKPLTLEEIVTRTPLDAKVNIFDYLRTPDRVLQKIGFGKEAQLLRRQYEEYVKELPKNIDTITAWSKRVPKESNIKLFRYLDGENVALNPTEMKVAGEIKDYLKTWADRLGLPEDNRIASYITHLFDDNFIQKEFDEDLAKIISDKIPGQVYDPFLEKRLGAKGYKQDVWAALDAYTKRATRKVHLDPALQKIKDKAGSSLEWSNLEKSQFDYIQMYVNRVNMRPTWIDNMIDTGFKQMFGYKGGQRPVARFSQALRRATYRGMLGLNLGSALRNLSQGVNTYAVLGERFTVVGYSKLFSKGNFDELTREGVLTQNFIEDRAISATKKAIEKLDKTVWVFFDTAEKINRGAAYFGAKSKALSNGMNEASAIEYAKGIVRKTQFSYDSVDTPLALSPDILKTFFQFQTYTTKQLEFLGELVKDKNFAALVRYAIGGTAFVYTIGQSMGMEIDEILPWYRFDTPPSLKLPVELGKAAIDYPDKYGKVPNTDKKIENITKATMGIIPGGMQIKKSVEGTQMVNEGGSFDAAGRKQFEQPEGTGAKLQSILFGKYANKNAKEYFDKKTNTGSKDLDKAIEADKESKSVSSKAAAVKYAELKKLPKDEANAQLKQIFDTDRPLYRKIKDKQAQEALNWTEEEEGINSLGVENGSRANYLVKKIEGMSKDEANVYLKDLFDRKIISNAVVDQIREKRSSTPVE